MAEVKIDESVIVFGQPKYHFGQRVFVEKSGGKNDTQPGYVIGMQRDKFCWSYLVAVGDTPARSMPEVMVEEYKVSLQ